MEKSEKEVVPAAKEKRKPASFCKLFSMMDAWPSVSSEPASEDAGDALVLLIGTIGGFVFAEPLKQRVRSAESQRFLTPSTMNVDFENR